jgi:hypothetical protein
MQYSLLVVILCQVLKYIIECSPSHYSNNDSFCMPTSIGEEIHYLALQTTEAGGRSGGQALCWLLVSTLIHKGWGLLLTIEGGATNYCINLLVFHDCLLWPYSTQRL